MKLLRKLQFWWRRDQLDRDLAEELEFHAQLQPHAKSMGNLTLAKENSRDAWSFLSIEHFFQDVRYALRGFAKNPGFTGVAVASLALGIAGNTAIFSFVNAVLIRPLPFPDSAHLVRITELYPKAILQFFQQRSQTMDVASVSPGSEFNLSGQGPATRLTASQTSVNFFFVLGANAEKGRTFTLSEDRPGQDGVAILSHELWMTQFNGKGDVLGRSITLGGIHRRIIGIMPANFALPSAHVQLWIPARMDPAVMEDYWGGEFAPLIARLRPGASLLQARAEIHSLAAGIWKLFPFPMPRHFNSGSTVISLQTDLAGDARGRLLLLLGAVGAVLLIACANVASLLLARATARRKEIAMRAALGAGSFRIIGQLLTESLVLSLTAGALGVLLGAATLSLFRPVLPAGLPGAAQIVVDWRVTGFALLLAALTGLVFGIFPAMHAARLDLAGAVKAGNQRSATQGWVRLRSWLIAGEIAVTLVLGAGAGLLVKSLYALTATNPGFNSERILTVKISPDKSFCASRNSCIAFYGRLLEEAKGVSGVADAAAVNTVPLDGELPTFPTDVEDHPKTAEFPAPMLWAGAITPNYLRLMQIPLLSGRAFSTADGADAPHVALITASTAKRFWPGVNAVGKHIRSVKEREWRTIVGVVADVRQFNLADRSPSSIAGEIYMPYAQAVQADGQISAVMNLVVKTTASAEQVDAEIRRIASAAGPDIPVGKVVPLGQIVSGSISGFRSTLWIFVAFAASGVVLAAIGIYGLTSYSVAQRTYEIGLRMAIGASNGSIARLVLFQSLRIAFLGVSVGVAASLLVTRLLSSLLVGVTATDPVIFGAVSLFLLLVAAAASALPAWRASRIDPIRTLRSE